ncbi:MAG: GerAB/ArcD/ProY family transporter [Oscillospiraceae bacterium]|nr:GerAB/ArcD/ProY family transporter [Oscillospiraceae bacterium]
MKEKAQGISRGQLWLAVLLMLLVDVVIDPHTAPAASGAQGVMIGVTIDVILMAAMTYPFLRIMRHPRMQRLFTGDDGRDRVLAGVLLIPLLLSAGAGVAQAEGFYRFVSDDRFVAWFFALLVLAVAFYGSHMGLEALMRSALVIGVLLAGSLIFLLIANASQFSVENLQFSKNLAQDVGNSVFSWFRFPGEALVYGILLEQTTEKRGKSFFTVLIVFWAVFLALVLSEELVLGPFAALQQQPLHTLARIGSISVFTRLDAIHVSVWIMLSIFRVSVYVLAALRLLKRCLPEEKRRLWLTPLAVILLAAACTLGFVLGVPVLQDIVTVSGLLASLFCVCAVCIRKAGKSV